MSIVNKILADRQTDRQSTIDRYLKFGSCQAFFHGIGVFL